MCGGGVLGVRLLVRTILNTKMYRNSDSHCQLRVTVRISAPTGPTQDFPAELHRFGVCAEPVCARARDYSTTPQTKSVTKFTFDDLT